MHLPDVNKERTLDLAHHSHFFHRWGNWSQLRSRAWPWTDYSESGFLGCKSGLISYASWGCCELMQTYHCVPLSPNSQLQAGTQHCSSSTALPPVPHLHPGLLSIWPHHPVPLPLPHSWPALGTAHLVCCESWTPSWTSGSRLSPGHSFYTSLSGWCSKTALGSSSSHLKKILHPFLIIKPKLLGLLFNIIPSPSSPWYVPNSLIFILHSASYLLLS